MRLHTNFHDYYDTAVGYGVDENVHYNRFTKETGINIEPHFDLPIYRGAGLLGFCGEIYPLVELRKFSRRYDESGYRDYKLLEVYHAYSFKEFDGKYSEWIDYIDFPEYFDHSRKVKLKQFFNDWSYKSDKIFLQYKVPIWTIDFNSGYEKNGLLNPKLKDFGFERIKDSFSAFQEISMYLANILIEQKETAEIEDKFRIEQHGFDLKKSFRKDKKL